MSCVLISLGGESQYVFVCQHRCVSAQRLSENKGHMEANLHHVPLSTSSVCLILFEKNKTKSQQQSMNDQQDTGVPR